MSRNYWARSPVKRCLPLDGGPARLTCALVSVGSALTSHTQTCLKKPTGSIKQGQREKVNILSFKAFYIFLESKIFSVRDTDDFCGWQSKMIDSCRRYSSRRNSKMWHLKCASVTLAALFTSSCLFLNILGDSNISAQIPVHLHLTISHIIRGHNNLSHI